MKKLFETVETAVKISIDRIKEFEPMALQNNPAGYYVCISGGKDSSVIQELCIMAGVKCEFVHNHTSVDHPETVYFIRREKERLESIGHIFRIEYPRFSDGKQKTMWNRIPIQGLPLRQQRWCCKELKEFGGKGRYVVTGIRWAESMRRKKNRGIHEFTGRKIGDHIILNNDNDMRRKLTEMCMQQNKIILNPIIDWTDEDVWDFIKLYDIPINPLYSKGYNRVGCIGCTMAGVKKRAIELNNNPKYKAAYFRSAKKYIERKYEKGLKIKNESPEQYFEWWLSG